MRQARRADHRPHVPALVQRHRADGTAFAVGDEQPRPVRRQAAGLRERSVAQFIRQRRQPRPVDDVLAPVAGIGADLPLIQGQPPNLVQTRHGDIQLVLMQPQIPRTVEGRLARAATKPIRGVRFSHRFRPGPRPAALHAGAGQRGDGLGCSGRPCAASGFPCRRRTVFPRSAKPCG